MAAAESRASLPADSIDFVNENNSGGAALCGVEKIAHTACTDADVKLDEFGTADGEEGDFGFTGNRFCKQCFACARRADKKHTFGNSCTHFGESFRIAQKIDNLAQLLFFFIGSGNIFKRDIVSEFIRRLCAALAEIHHLGISAATARKRPAFNRMIALAKEKERPFDAILVLMFSRFARNREESVLYKGLLRKQGISVISVKEPAVDGPFGTLIESIIEWFDEYYLINLSAEVKRGMSEKFLRGEAMGTAPFGYRIDSANKTFTVDPERAEIVCDVFRSYADGAGLRDIAVQLGDAGITTRRGNRPDSRFVEYMLRNPVYIGKIRWTPGHKTRYSRVHIADGVEVVDGKHPPIVSMDLWEAVQRRMDQRKAAYGRYQRQAPAAWMMRGLVRCSACGATLIMAGRSSSCPFLQCHSYAKGACHMSHSLSLRRANGAVLAGLQRSVGTLTFHMVPHLTSAPSRTADYGRLLEQERRRLARCKDAYQAGVDTLEEYRDNKARLEERIRRIEEQAASAAAAPESFDKAAYGKKAADILRFLETSADEGAKNEVLRSVVDHITYEKASRHLAIYFYT